MMRGRERLRQRDRVNTQIDFKNEVGKGGNSDKSLFLSSSKRAYFKTENVLKASFLVSK